MLHGAVRLHEGVAAVVVGEQQSLGGDELAGTAAAEEDDGVLHAVVVDAVNVLRRQPEAELLHFGLVVVEEEGQPHAAVGAGHSEEGRK